MSSEPDDGSQHPTEGVDPGSFLRALLAISPEDAAEAREDAAKLLEPQTEANE